MFPSNITINEVLRVLCAWSGFIAIFLILLESFPLRG